MSLAEMKKIEVSQHISKVIDQIRQLEDEFHNEIEEFKNNRLAYVFLHLLDNRYLYHLS